MSTFSFFPLFPLSAGRCPLSAGSFEISTFHILRIHTVPSVRSFVSLAFHCFSAAFFDSKMSFHMRHDKQGKTCPVKGMLFIKHQCMQYVRVSQGICQSEVTCCCCLSRVKARKCERKCCLLTFESEFRFKCCSLRRNQ